ncbi:MAG: hypothetical protein IT184_11590 [Acidobacteria bacterium]|nr:hypothetical protein [Acidobacteriota bacterium]
MNVAAAPLHVRDGAFRQPDGSIWKYRGVTAFTALHDVVGGRWDKLDRYASWTLGLGANAWRVFAMWGNLNFSPRRTPGYDETLASLVEWLNRRGLVLHLVALCDQIDGSAVRLSRDEQDAHVRRVAAALRGKGALGELVNEDWKNGRLAERFPAGWLTGAPWTRSAAAQNEPPSAPGRYLQFTTHHTARDGEWPRHAMQLIDVARLGFPGHAATLLPAIAGEPIRMDEATPEDYADYVALAELAAAGACLHGGFSSFDPATTTDLQNCVAPPPGSAGDRVARAVAEVWAAGIDPDLASTGRFVSGGSADCPVLHREGRALGTFAMTAGDRAVAVVVRLAPGDEPAPQQGWRIVRRVRNVFFCERPRVSGSSLRPRTADAIRRAPSFPARRAAFGATRDRPS